ncbi:succinyldiaminopimelate transaminase [Pseudonocardia spinosispora]|uniref:succinyldiaminopimelate transaminase n=1 Tax=Pseudonocardia spinosispora TaxID=103441 RepID=UPI0003F5560D|nr:succinyldiaminopimelate transaminase [Pseudonocardia spinosispora]
MTEARRLPDFPWDSLTDAKARAAAHPGGIVDLSVGTPVDEVPTVITSAAASQPAQAPGYPATWGTPELRSAVTDAMHRRYEVSGLDPDAVLPTIGSKEMVAWLPTLLGLRPGDVVGVPELAYPTYEVGARLAGADVIRADSTFALGPGPVRLLWLNSPSNPTGRVLPAEHLRKVVDWARERGTIVASDECYLALSDPGDGAVSVLHESVSGGDPTGLLAVHSLSKSSNLAGYRAGYVTGDPALVAQLLEVRKHAGMIVPRPVQTAMVAALTDDDHVHRQWQRYRSRRERLRAALVGFGLKIEHSEAGLYLWATAGEQCRLTVGRLAEHGVLVAPGEFYGPAGAEHVRVAATATDERIDEAVRRLQPPE